MSPPRCLYTARLGGAQVLNARNGLPIHDFHPQRGSMIKLTLTEKGGEPKVLTFDKDEITIGRVSGNDIVLAKGNISKRHTRLTKKDNGLEIADLKSTNGTYVNGRKIAGPTPVAPSDRIYVGDFLIGIDGPGAALAEQGGLHS